MRPGLISSAALAAAISVGAAPSSASSASSNLLPLELVLSMKGGAKVQVEIKNPNKETVKVLRVDSFLAAGPWTKAHIVVKDEPVNFLGCSANLDFGDLGDKHFSHFSHKHSDKMEINLAEVNDLSMGGLFNVTMSGSLPYTRGKSKDIEGYIPYHSNTLELIVNGHDAALARADFVRKPKIDYKNCYKDREKKMLETLDSCIEVAEAAKLRALKDDWRMQEAFGTDDQASREYVAKALSYVEETCREQRKHYNLHCPELYGACLPRDKVVTTYLHPYSHMVGYCDGFFDLPAEPPKCYKKGKDGWARSRIGTMVRELIRSYLSKTSEAGIMQDYARELPDIFTLTPERSLRNADNYELFAAHIELECKPVKIPRGNYNTPRKNGASSGESSIDWAPCDLDLEEDKMRKEPRDCATIEVPLDYKNPNSGETIDIQLIRARATKKAKGNILVNPGGPGASGVELVAYAGHILRDQLDGHFNIIGFDPRGTGRTIPFMCTAPWGSMSPSGLTGLLRRDRLSQTDPWPKLRDTEWTSSGDRADSCLTNMGETGSYIGTAFVARDMLAIADALEKGSKLWYWGTSYGTVLGQTFAAMFPDRVGRFLLDGNLLADDYYTSAWSRSPIDTERALDHLLSECIEVNKGKKDNRLCPLADSGETSRELKQRLTKVLDEWMTEETVPPGLGPIPSSFLDGGTGLVAAIKTKIFQDLYRLQLWVGLAKFIAAVIEEDWEAVGEAIRAHPFAGSSITKVDSAMPISVWNEGEDSYWGIQCGDSSLRVEEPDELYSIMQAHLETSSFADVVVTGRLVCARWKQYAAERVNTNIFRNVKTSNPILFANGRYDPGTPLAHAWEASSRFRGSRVLVYNGIGHGFMEHPSNCTRHAIVRYFLRGELPEIGTVCEPDEMAFEAARRLGG
ncbi:hydrolase or acyltransferase (alpha beta hydrolase superfamily) [Fusarium albosuccineum]|uniref:deuterolysin n=1 Tax=Fusarium albosuccineum TaxID=1237068 RepID=A0A8H4P8S1_9HYPO|nr:hydrolase or acyltransferase (alpha beta hydrolase superfamily) [Fusarium albosuccineum]